MSTCVRVCVCVCMCVCVVLSCRVVILQGQLAQSSVTAILLHNVSQLFQALRCKPEGRGFVSFRPHYVPGVESASNGIESQEYFLVGKGGRCVGLTTLPPSCADCLEIWEP